MQTLKSHWPFGLILITYLVIGTLYAAYTPIWQVPDEPAHYNYIHALATAQRFPIMENGDYDQTYLSRLTSEKFPVTSSTKTLGNLFFYPTVQYEDHQPPLYYLLATPVFWLFNGQLLPLRLFSLCIGGVAVTLVYTIAREVFPARASYALLASGLVAFLPQHIAMMAGVNNDALLEALLFLWLLLALRYLRGAAPAWSLGITLGALLLTKTTGYGALVLAPLTLGLRWRREQSSTSKKNKASPSPTFSLPRHAAHIFAPALLLGLLWWGRNLSVYGWPDALGMLRHNAVVVGQPRTINWIARDGLLAFLISASRTTFRSFWGQFGWMGVVLDARIYQGALIFTALSMWGALWWITEFLQQKPLPPRQRDALLLLTASALITLALYVGYNLTFVQHQGRYLFTALPTLALLAALGLERLTERSLARTTSLGLLGLVVLLGLLGLLRADLPFWITVLMITATIAVIVNSLLPDAYRSLGGIALLGSLALLDLWCLFGFIIPILTQ